ncbi:MAG: hypothetical protein ACRD2M_08045 [Terriglobales bacterium]
MTIPRGWAAATIGDLVGRDGVFVDGDWIETKDQDPNGDVRLVQLADIGDGVFQDRSRRFLTSKTAHRLNCTFLREGDVLVARMPEPLGRATIFPGNLRPCITAVDVCIVRTGVTGANHRWLMWTINSPEIRRKIGALQKGTTRRRISRSNLATIGFLVPPPAEQDRIVAEIEKQFTRLEAAVAALKRVQANLKRYRAAVLKAACEGRLVPFNFVREVPLSDVLREPLVNGRSPSASNTGTAILRLTAMRTDSIDLEEVRLGELSGDQQRVFAVRRGDIFVSRGNGSIRLVGRASLVRNDPKDLIAFPDTMIRIRLNEQMCHPEYFLYVWNSEFVRSQIERTARTTAGIHKISQRDMERMTIPLPSLQEQRELVRKLQAKFSTADRVADSIRVELRRADRLRQAILKRAFEGGLVPQDPNDEPASVLLERIRAEHVAGKTPYSKVRRIRRAMVAG